MEPTDSRLNLCISPDHKLLYLYEDNSFNRKLDVFESRTKGWFFDHIKTLMNSGNQHVGFAVLHLVLSYFEMIAKYKDSQLKKSGIAFKKGILYVFPELIDYQNRDTILGYLWASARNGLYHTGMTNGKIFLRDSVSEPPTPIEFENDKVYLDRKLFPIRVFDHFDAYITELRCGEDTNMIDNFERTWERINKDKIYPFHG